MTHKEQMAEWPDWIKKVSSNLEHDLPADRITLKGALVWLQRYRNDNKEWTSEAAEDLAMAIQEYLDL